MIHMNSPGLRPMGVSDLGYESLVLVLKPPQTPPEGPQGRACLGANVPHPPLGRSMLRSIYRFDFDFDFGLVLDSSWARLGLLMAPFSELKSGQVGS